MTEELEQLLKNLRLRRMLSVYDEQLQAAEKAQVPYTEFVAGLLRTQWHERQESALEWRIHRANPPERWSLETFPWSHHPGVNRKQMRTFAELDFVAKHENLVLVGPTGVGKTGLACGLLDHWHKCTFNLVRISARAATGGALNEWNCPQSRLARPVRARHFRKRPTLRLRLWPRLCRTDTAVSSCGRRICSMRCMPRWRIAPRGSC
jgi:hypothetical protein